MSAALSLARMDRESTEELHFAEIEHQHAELLPSRTVLSTLKGGLFGGGDWGGGRGACSASASSASCSPVGSSD